MHKVLIVNNYQEITDDFPLKIESFTNTPLEWLIKVRDPAQENIILLTLKRDIRKIRSDAKIERLRMIEEAAQLKQIEMSVNIDQVKDDVREEGQLRQITEVKSEKKQETLQPIIENPQIENQKISITATLSIVAPVVESKVVQVELVRELKQPSSPLQINTTNVIERKEEVILPEQPPAQTLIPQKPQIEKPLDLNQQQIIIEPRANISIKKSLTSNESSKNKEKQQNPISQTSKPMVIQNETLSRIKHSVMDFGLTEDRHLCEMSIDDDSIQFDDTNLLDNKTFREHLEKTSKLLDMIRDNSPPPLIVEISHEQHKKSFHDSLYDRSNTQLNAKLQPNQKNKLEIQASSHRRDTKTPVDKSKSPAFQKLIKKPNYAAATTATDASKKQQHVQVSVSPQQTRKNVSISPPPKPKQKVSAVNKSIKERSNENSPKKGSDNKKSTQKINQVNSVSPSQHQIKIKPVKVVQKQKELIKVDIKVSAEARSFNQEKEKVSQTSPKKEILRETKQKTEQTSRTSVPPQSVRSVTVTQKTNPERARSIIKVAPIKLPVSKPSMTPSLDTSTTPKYTPSIRLRTKRSPPINVTNLGDDNLVNSDYQDFVKSAVINQKGEDSPSPSLLKNKQPKIRVIKKNTPERSLDSAASPRRTSQAPTQVNNKKFESEWFSSIMQQEFQKECANGQKVDQIKQYLQNIRTINHNLKKKSPKGSPRKNQSQEQRDSVVNESAVMGNDPFTQDSIAGRTLETDFFEETERPAPQNRYQKESGLDVKYNPADKYRTFKKQRTVQQSSKQNRILTIQEPPIESQSINVAKINQQQDGALPQEDIKRFTFNRSGTKQIKDGANNDKNDIFRQLSPSSRAQSSPKAFRQLNPLNQVFMPGEQLQVPHIKLPDFKKKFTTGNATTAINTNNNQASQDTFKSSLMKTEIFQQPKDEMIVLNVDIESVNRERGVNPLSQISMRPQTKVIVTPGDDPMIKKRQGEKLEPINNKSKRAEIFGNMKNHDQVITFAAKESLTYPDISVNFSNANNNTFFPESDHSKKFGQVSPFHQQVLGGTFYPRASSNLSKTGQRLESFNKKLTEHDNLRDNLNYTQFHNGDLGNPRRIKKRQFGQGISQTKNESPWLSMFFQDSIRGGSMIEDFHSSGKRRDISTLRTGGQSTNGSQNASNHSKTNSFVLPSTTERKNASTQREAKNQNKFPHNTYLIEAQIS